LQVSDEDEVSHNSRLDEQAGVVGALLKLQSQHHTSLNEAPGLFMRAAL
jgi:hypothetical protein